MIKIVRQAQIVENRENKVVDNQKAVESVWIKQFSQLNLKVQVNSVLKGDNARKTNNNKIIW